MTILEELIEYSNEVINENIPACQKHKWACQRFLNDVDRIENDDNFHYVWDEDKAQRIYDWFTFLRHTKGVLAGEPIYLTTWQKFSVCQMFGWIHKETGYRRFTKAYKQVGKKNAKSQELSGIALYMLCADGEDAPEVYCAATKRDQSKVVFDESVKMARRSPYLNDPNRLKLNQNELRHIKSDGIMKPLSKEDKKFADGYNPSMAVIDEYHLHETSEIYDILDAGMVARQQPLIYVITTAGYDLSVPCYRVEYDYVTKILNPNSEVENDNYFAIVNELDEEDDIKEESNWEKANPIVTTYDEGLNYLRNQLKIAQDAPEKMRTFLTKNMNVWIQQKEGGYMDLEKWQNCGVDEMPDVTGLPAYVGVDLSATLDLTSVAIEVPLDNEYYAVWGHSFMPEETFYQKIRVDKVPYDVWAREGWLTLTDGAVIDYNFVKEYIKKRVQELGCFVKELCYDPYNATQFAQEMMDEGYEAVEIRQGHKTLSEPTKDFKTQIVSGKVYHNKNPVINWALSNAVVRLDANENIVLDKKKSRQRIDPAAAIMNAHTRAMIVGQEKPSVYEERGVRVL